MSEVLGTMVYVDADQPGIFGPMSSKSVSEATQQKVDVEIRAILDRQYAVAKKILEENKDKVEVMVKALLEWETIDADQVSDIMAGKEPRPPKYPPTTPSGGPSGGTPVVAEGGAPAAA
jgi:cell division protease FtsH